jgi:hypothetical protein
LNVRYFANLQKKNLMSDSDVLAGWDLFCEREQERYWGSEDSEEDTEPDWELIAEAQAEARYEQ